MEPESNILQGVDVVKCWKDPEYRESLSPEQQAALPPAPANLDELSEEELDDLSGGTASVSILCVSVAL